jgi:hypothetical protein
LTNCLISKPITRAISVRIEAPAAYVLDGASLAFSTQGSQSHLPGHHPGKEHRAVELVMFDVEGQIASAVDLNHEFAEGNRPPAAGHESWDI